MSSGSEYVMATPVIAGKTATAEARSALVAAPRMVRTPLERAAHALRTSGTGCRRERQGASDPSEGTAETARRCNEQHAIRPRAAAPSGFRGRAPKPDAGPIHVPSDAAR